jgi:hypothetical protein
MEAAERPGAPGPQLRLPRPVAEFRHAASRRAGPFAAMVVAVAGFRAERRGLSRKIANLS